MQQKNKTFDTISYEKDQSYRTRAHTHPRTPAHTHNKHVLGLQYMCVFG